MDRKFETTADRAAMETRDHLYTGEEVSASEMLRKQASAKAQYATGSGSILRGSPPIPGPPTGKLDTLFERIMQEAECLRRMASRLNEHADQVHGHGPETDAIGTLDQSIPDARMHRIEYAIEVLTESRRAIEYAAERNTGLV